MVKVELSYNPYLLETNIKFNGQIPRINSLVEKYQKNILQTWVDKIPSIFYDEMNGYDFELEFSGTKLEFQDLCNAFYNVDVTNEMVRLFHKNELDGRKTKTDKLDELLEWFKQTPNRKFDFTTFIEQNNEFFTSDYVCILLNGRGITQEMFDEYKVSLEIIEDINELVNTELLHTPIIIWVDVETRAKLKSNVRYFLNRKDVAQNQIFFMLHPSLNALSIGRTIQDLGIENPQLITNVKDEKVKYFLEVYPVTDYITDAIKMLRQQEGEIAEILDKENEESMISNKEVHQQIDNLEDIIRRLKESLELFVNRDELDLFSKAKEFKSQLLDSIQNWKSRKTKITKESEAIYLAHDLEQHMVKLYQQFYRNIEDYFENIRDKIECNYKEWYKKAEYEMDFIANTVTVENLYKQELPLITSELLRMKKEKYVTPKDDLFGKIFKSSNDREIEPVLEINFYCQEWRDYVVSVMEPIVDELIQEKETLVKKYTFEQAEIYISKLNQLIEERTIVKENVSKQLSDDELKLQVDNDWLVCFQDQLRAIERG